MDDRLIFFQVDTGFHWNTWAENQQKAFALETIREWIGSDNFKVAASFSELNAETTIGRCLTELESEDQFWKSERYQRVRGVLQGVIDFWVQSKWARIETTRNGRPRRVEHSAKRVSKASRYQDQPFLVIDEGTDPLYRNVLWSKSILGENSVQTWIRLVLIEENLFSEFVRKAGAEHLSGKTKEEIAEDLHLPKAFVNEMCRWMEKSGCWKVVKCRREGVSRRELRYTVM